MSAASDANEDDIVRSTRTRRNKVKNGYGHGVAAQEVQGSNPGSAG
jgi:hypothetical protein